jgi:hypothetical protein
MKNITKRFLFFIVFFFFLSSQVCAIGTWQEGVVTKAPWVDQHTYIQIDKVKFTIMEGAKIVHSYQRKGATYKDRIGPQAIVNGDRLFYKNEGNRIYQIERIR